MNLAPTTEIRVKELLCDAGRIASNQEISLEPMPGNPDRRDYTTRRRFLVRSKDTIVAVLVVGKDLTQLRQRSELFSQAYPELACPVFSHGKSEDNDLLLTEYFSGQTASDALGNPSIGEPGVLTAVQRLAERFKNEIKPSSAEALAKELDALKSNILGIRYWTSADRTFLENIVFPFATKTLTNLPAVCRVTNGDFVLSNILLNAQGEVRVIDYEQAAATHFYEEDWLRLTYWKTSGKVRAFALSQVGNSEAIQLYLWLKQLFFEAEVNQPAKAQSDLQHWGREIRRMLDQHSPDLQNSLLWPTEKRSEVSQLLQLQSRAHYNYTRALELFAFARQREIKIRQMQSSFSWRATAWLRALRRNFIDPYVRQKSEEGSSSATTMKNCDAVLPFAVTDFFRPATIPLRFGIERPGDWAVAMGNVTVEGWVYTDLAIKLVQVRARLDDRMFSGTYGIDRTDIAEKFLPQSSSGFCLELHIENNSKEIILEVADEQGVWYPFFSKSLITLRTPPATRDFRRYSSWVARHDTLEAGQIETLKRVARAITNAPLISVVMPVHNTPASFLAMAIESVRAQVYEHWELCIADDGSTHAHIRPLLEQFALKDPRIKIVHREQTGHISAASNSALEIATGDYTAFFDHDDELPPHALLCVAQQIVANPTAELIYSDEDKIDETGQRFAPHFKPDWNPDLLTSQNYICHLATYKTATLRAVGGLKVGYEGSQDWDLALRVTERISPAQIIHIPRILYHWRAIAGSTAALLSAKKYIGDASRKTLADHFTRLGKSPTLNRIIGGHWRIQYNLPDPAPLVTLIIPTRNRRELLVRCIDSILEITRYKRFEILVADNESDDPALARYLAKIGRQHPVSVLPCPGPFNFSAINNRAVEHAKGEIIGLLNNDLEAINPDWLNEMVSQAARPEIGVVGAKLYYPDQTIQHAGVITGLGGVAGHAFKHFPRRDPGNLQYRALVVHNVSAVTAACAVLRKSVYLEAGGLNEEELKVAFNDVDFCLRVQDLGYRNLFTPFAEFIHHESASRGAEDSPEKAGRFRDEVEYMNRQWGERLQNDPAYNPNLSLESGDFPFASPPRLPPLT